MFEDKRKTAEAAADILSQLNYDLYRTRDLEGVFAGGNAGNTILALALIEASKNVSAALQSQANALNALVEELANHRAPTITGSSLNTEEMVESYKTAYSGSDAQ